MRLHRLIAIAGTFLSLSACLPGMSPVGSPSNPAAGKSSSGESEVTSVPQEDAGAIEGPAEPHQAVPRAGDSSGLPVSFAERRADAPGTEYSTRQLAMGGDFPPKPDEVSVDDLATIKDWRALYGAGASTELSKTVPSYMPAGSSPGFDLRLDVQGYFMINGYFFWSGVLPGRTVRIVIKPAGAEPSGYRMVDALTHDKTPEGYNVDFLNLGPLDGTIDVFLYWGEVKADGNYEVPSADYTAFMSDPKRLYLGTFTTRAPVTEAYREQRMILKP